jgi:hypothetical protein
MEQNQEINVTAYSLMEFCQIVEQRIKEGYSFDFDTPANVPVSFGSHLTSVMVKKAPEVKGESVVQTARKPKSEAKAE